MLGVLFRLYGVPPSIMAEKHMEGFTCRGEMTVIYFFEVINLYRVRERGFEEKKRNV